MSWDKIKGQEKAIERLKTEIVNDKVTQSYLFSGIEGIGKKLVALEFIKTLNCHSPYLNLSCENCINCNKINKHLHPEVTILTPLNNIISIEQIRNLQRNLALKPLNVKIKSFIIDEAEKFTLESSNCFLKSLEEPPEKVIFILVTSKKSVILPTITSRCKEIKFIPLFKEEQRKILKDWSSKEDVLELLIDLCEGSPGRAKKYLNLNITYWFQQVVSWIPKLLKKNLEDFHKISQEFTTLNDQELVLMILDLFFYYFSSFILRPEKNILSLRKSVLKRLVKIVEQTKQKIYQKVNLTLALEVMLLNIMDVENEQYC